MTATVRIPRRSKYGNVRTEYNGVMYDSAAEARYAASLDLRKKVSDIEDWFRQVRTPLVVKGVRIAHIVPDFSILHKDKTIEYVEIKGAITEVWRLRMKLFKALYPGVKYTVIKAGNVA